MTSFREARNVIFLSCDQGLTLMRSVCCCMILASLKTWICSTACTQHLTTVKDKKGKDVIPGKPEVLNTFLIKEETMYDRF